MNVIHASKEPELHVVYMVITKSPGLQLAEDIFIVQPVKAEEL